MTPSRRTPTVLPTTREELDALGWNRPDVILVTGDTYIDSSYMGVAVIGRVLLDAGFRVGIIAQPDMNSGADIARLGEPTLFWGVTGGAMDSMVANYTASGKRRKSDDLTPGGLNTRRPDRAVIAYANLIRRHFKQTVPIVLGGIEASLRRISHYDAWSDSVRRSVLFDAKADYLVYGMGERTILELAAALKAGGDIRPIRGLCYISREPPEPVPDFPGPAVALPPHEIAAKDKDAFIRMFRLFHANADPLSAVPLYQRQDTRYLVQNPPATPLSSSALDRVYELPYTCEVHPFYAWDGKVPALDTIRFSLTTHRGCYGECRFCAISLHQGRYVVSRSEASIRREAAGFATHPEFKGIIADVGGPTANMYGFECAKKSAEGACRERGCLFPAPCKHLPVSHERQIRLLRELRELKGIRRVFVASGIRYDLILKDTTAGERYLEELLRHHVSGQLKTAPEHVSPRILSLMGKPGPKTLEAFLRLFQNTVRNCPNRSFLTYYFIAAHPGCALEDMKDARDYALRTLRLLPEQVQGFTPTPATWSTLMYHTETDPFSGKSLFVEKSFKGRQDQKNILGSKGRRKKRPARRKSGASRHGILENG